MVDYVDAPGEVRRTADGALLAELSGRVFGVEFSPDEAALFFIVDYFDGRYELWRRDSPVRLADLGVNLGSWIFSSGNDSLAVAHDDGRAYLLDLAWLREMDGRGEELSIEELVSIACAGPMSRGLLAEDVLMSFLEQVGIDEPQACR